MNQRVIAQSYGSGRSRQLQPDGWSPCWRHVGGLPHRFRCSFLLEWRQEVSALKARVSAPERNPDLIEVLSGEALFTHRDAYVQGLASVGGTQPPSTSTGHWNCQSWGLSDIGGGGENFNQNGIQTRLMRS